MADADEAAVFGRHVVPDVPYSTLPSPVRPAVGTPSTRSERFAKAINVTRESRLEKELYREGNLNEEQKQIFLYMRANPSAMVLIQAGPGTGKTFTQLTLAHAWTKDVKVIIFKHDLLYTFRNCAKQHTVTSFCMAVWELSYPSWCGLERQLSGRMSGNQFISCVVGLLRRSRLPTMAAGTIVLLDEYTVIPKPILFALLMLLKRNRIGTVISGDKNQLQNIHNSMHMGRCSSYDIAAAFADRTFALTKNERCSDVEYNRLVDYVSRYSSDKKLDKFGYALAAALFHRKFMTESAITDTHLAAHHRTLTGIVHMMTVNESIPFSFHFINAAAVVDQSRVQGARQGNGLILPSVTLKYIQTGAPDKYLPYTPLVVGCRYFLKQHSEHSQCTLESVDEARGTVTVRSDDGKRKTVGKENCNDVMFDRHRRFMLSGGDDTVEGVGQLYNYPIYMANVMSIHMCQGRTIRNAIDIVLNESTYQGLYVSMSRVTSPQHITRVIVPDMPAHLLSTVVNFPQLCARPDGAITVDELDACMSRNYMHYPLRDAELTSTTVYSLGQFFASRDVGERRRIREDLCRVADKIRPEVLNGGPKEISPSAADGAIMTLVLRYKYTMMAIALLDNRDAVVWLHEFMRRDPLVTLLGVDPQSSGRSTADDDGTRFGSLFNICDVAEHAYEPNEDTLRYIVRHAKWTAKDESGRQYWIEENETTRCVLETSEFRRTVHGELSAGRPITVVWLMDRLRSMLQDLRRPESGPDTSEVVRSERASTAAAASTTSLGQLLEQSTMNRDNAEPYRPATLKLQPFKRQRRS